MLFTGKHTLRKRERQRLGHGLGLAGFFLGVGIILMGCRASGGPLSGTVLDSATGEPIEGAIAVVRWVGSLSSLVDGRTVCVHVETAWTDGKGRYHIPAWNKSLKIGPVVGIDWEPVIVHKAGYRQDVDREVKEQSHRKGISYLIEDTGSREERLEYLQRSTVYCHQAGDSENNLLPLANGLYEEAASIGQAKNKQQIVSRLLYYLERIELGYEAAEQRYIKRTRGAK